MARLASEVKMGFYPTPFEALHRICNFLNVDAEEKIHVLDPCCGEGEAIRYLRSELFGEVVTYGIELDNERFLKASNTLDYVVHGSIFEARINPLGSMGLLWLNPPYSNEENDRTEMKFLRHAIKWLCEDGILIFLVPESLFNNRRNREWISVNFKSVKVFRFPEEEFVKFKQVVLFGVKGRGDKEVPAPPYSEIPYGREVLSHWKYTIPSTEGPKVFQCGEGVTLEEIEKFRPRLIAELKKLCSSSNGFRLKPLLPLRKGHLVALLTAGLLDGKIETADGGFILVKGFSDRITTTWVDEESKKEITKNTYSVGIRVMEEGGNWYDIR